MTRQVRADSPLWTERQLAKVRAKKIKVLTRIDWLSEIRRKYGGLSKWNRTSYEALHQDLLILDDLADYLEERLDRSRVPENT